MNEVEKYRLWNQETLQIYQSNFDDPPDKDGIHYSSPESSSDSLYSVLERAHCQC